MELEEYFSLSRPKLKSKKLEEGILYVNMDQVSMKDIKDLMPELQKAKAIICDLRGYPKATVPFLTQLLKEEDKSGAWMKVPRIIYPDYEKVTYESHGWLLKPTKPRLEAEIVFITHHRAISYAESYMGFVEHYNLATIVGQPTAGTNGNVNPLLLPGGYRIFWTGMRVVKHDGTQHHGVGILPDVPVKRTIKAVTENRDEFLEKAIEVAKEKIKKNISKPVSETDAG